MAGFGTLGMPDVTITDMSTLTQIGSPTFTSDGKSGQAVVSDFAGARVEGATLAGAAADQFLTYAFLFNTPANAAFGYIFNMDNGTTIRNATIQLPTDGIARGQLFGGAPITVETNVTTTVTDDSTTRICVFTKDHGTSGNKTDHTFSTYIGTLSGALQETVSVQSVNMEDWAALTIGIYGTTAGGAFPMPNGAWIGQVRSWHNKFCNLADAQAIQGEYDSGKFGIATGNIIDTVYPEVHPDNGIIPNNIIT